MVPPGLPFLLALPARVLMYFLWIDEQSEASLDVVFRPPQHSITTSPAFAVASDQYAKDWSFACAMTQGVSHVLSVPLFAEGFAPFPFSSAVPCSSEISTDEMNKTFFEEKTKSPNDPGPARIRSRDRSKAQAKGKEEGKGREGRKEGRKGKREGRSGPAARKGAGLLRRGWIDGSMDREEGNRSSGGAREGSRQNQKREANVRVAWTAVVGVCFIDRTW
jgi:hypothetical protein